MLTVNRTLRTNRTIASKTVVCQLFLRVIVARIHRLITTSFFVSRVARLRNRYRRIKPRSNIFFRRFPSRIRKWLVSRSSRRSFVVFIVRLPIIFWICLIFIRASLGRHFFLPALDTTIHFLQFNHTRFIQLGNLSTLRAYIHLHHFHFTIEFGGSFST